MGNCCSNTSTELNSPPGGVPRETQPNVQTSEVRRDVPLPLSPQERGATLEPLSSVQPGVFPAPPSQSDGKTSQRAPPGSGRSRSSSSPHYSTKSNSPYPSYDSARVPLPASGREMSQKPSPTSGRSRFLSSPDHVSKPNSAYPSYDRARVGSSPAPAAAASSSSLGRVHAHGYRHRNRIDSAPDPRSTPRAALKPAAARGNNTGPFPSTMREALPDGFRFRTLVLGKSQSGKSSLINAVFNIDMAAAPGSQRNVDINVGFSPSNNRYLVVHEYSGFGSGDAQSLQTIRDFILYHTDASRSVSERLHAIWICVPMSDAIERRLGEGVKEILDMKNVPAMIVFTKFDLLVSRVQFDVTRSHEQPMARAHAMYEDLCSSLFHKDPKDVPAVIFSEKRAYRDLIGELTSTTHGIIRADSRNSAGRPTSSQVQLPGIPIAPALLAWSVAQRVNHDIIIQASIEVGRSRYWRSLGSSQDFTGQALESCVNVIHEDIINVWNFDDRERYLLSSDLTARMSHLVGDLAGSPAISPDLYLNGTSTPMAQWMDGPYQNNKRNIRCVMAYIVDLTVILHGLFVSARSVSATKVQSAVKDYAKSGSRSQIHDEIRSFVTEIPLTYHERDTIMEKIVDLIKQNCVPNL
ncbi:hypothetical protein BJY52DRAFT_1276672 [Lactarius psammicola]|nr:hypothetical protein BJY52DRAFT_1276672 [Lactarius psammicola]